MLVSAQSMSAYFREALTEARAELCLPLSDTAQAYLVHLLTQFGRAEHAYSGTDAGESPALALLLSRAVDVPTDEALRIFKHVGDSSLYRTGFFADSLEREVVDETYYVHMGENAYASASDLVRPHAASSAAVYTELAERFSGAVALLRTIALHGLSRAEALSDAAVLGLVDRYRRTGDHALLKVLQKHGVVLRPGLSEPSVLLH